MSVDRKRRGGGASAGAGFLQKPGLGRAHALSFGRSPVVVTAQVKNAVGQGFFELGPEGTATAGTAGDGCGGQDHVAQQHGLI